MQEKKIPLNELLQALRQTFEPKSLSQTLKVLASHVWQKIYFSRKGLGLKTYEVSVTQEILYLLTLATNTTSVYAREAESEKNHGNDIDLYLEVDHGKYVLIPMQAKILHRSNKYGHLAHENKQGIQIDLLINYAKNQGGYPLYLLYNYSANSTLKRMIWENLGINPVHFGISISSAEVLKREFVDKPSSRPNSLSRKNAPTFEQIHPRWARPFYQLLCIPDYLIMNETKGTLKGFLEEEDWDLKIYDEKELEFLMEQGWKELFIMDLDPEEFQSKEVADSDYDTQLKKWEDKYDEEIVYLQKLSAKEESVKSTAESVRKSQTRKPGAIIKFRLQDEES